MITNSISLTSHSAKSSIDTSKKQAQSLQKTLHRLETGKKTTPAYENPVDNAKVGTLKSELKAQSTLITELNDKYTMLNIAENGLTQQLSTVNSIEQKIKESLSDTITKDQKESLYQESIKLLDDINDIANQTSYKGINLLNGNLEKSKINTGTQTYQQIEIDIPSKDINKITRVRFETGDAITKSEEVALEFQLSEDENIALDPVIISHSVGTGLGELAKEINKNRDTLGFKASYSISTIGDKPIEKGFLKNFVINEKEIGSIEIKNSEDQHKLVKLINKKSDQTGVEASLENGTIHLQNPSGRGIKMRAVSGLNILNIPKGLEENYGKLTLINYNGEASNIVNNKPIGFNKLNSEKFGLNYFSRGSFSLDERKAIGFETDDVKNTAKFDLSNDTFGANFLEMVEATRENLESSREEIDFVRNQILKYRNQAISQKSDIDISISNLEDIDYSKEIFNKTKFEQLQKGALYTFGQSLQHQETIYKILFDNLQRNAN